MRDAQYPLRLACFNVLTGAVSFNSQVIGFYDEKKRAAGNIYCIFGTQQSTRSPESTDCMWVTDETIDIEIWHKTGSEVSKDIIDSVSNQIYTLLSPATLTAGFANPSLMQVLFFDLQNAITRAFEITPTESVTGKIITFKCTIVQQSP